MFKTSFQKVAKLFAKMAVCKYKEKSQSFIILARFCELLLCPPTLWKVFSEIRYRSVSIRQTVVESVPNRQKVSRFGTELIKVWRIGTESTNFPRTLVDSVPNRLSFGESVPIRQKLVESVPIESDRYRISDKIFHRVIFHQISKIRPSINLEQNLWLNSPRRCM